MPLPLIFAVKGAVVVGKWIVSKHMAANVARTVVMSTKAIGAANTVNAVVAGTVLVGVGVWSHERLKMARKAVRFARDGDLLGAANEVTRIVRSAYQVDGDQFLDTARHWVETGASIHSSDFRSIISDLRQLVDETNLTAKSA
jgi:hypothetical protein